MNSKTILQHSKDAALKRAELREQGICVECGHEPIGKNADNTVSVHCDDCRERHRARKAKYRSKKVTAANAGKIDSRSIYGIPDAPDFRDGKEFKDYAKAIMSILLKAKSPLKIREIHDRLGDMANRNWTMLALENPAIKWNEAYIDTYEIRHRFVKDLRVRSQHNGKIIIAINPPEHNGRAVPDTASFYNNRNRERA